MLASTRLPLPEREYDFGMEGTRGAVALLEGCVMSGLFARTNRATRRTLRANDYRVRGAPNQACCGALHAHAGDLETARTLARQNVEAFEKSGAEFIGVNAAGCGAMMKEYGHLLGDDPDWADRAAAMAARVRDVSELLAAAGPRPGAPLPLRVTYDAPCHLLHAQRVVAPPLAVLRAVPELTLLPLTDSEQCCGAAGIYNLLEPATSNAVLAPKLRHIASTGADWVATGNPGCLMQIGAGLRLAHARARAVHPIDLLDASYARASETRQSEPTRQDGD
jgi:glycolate oxidase iron-sulfur subunit